MNQKETREFLRQTARDYCMSVERVRKIYERVGLLKVYEELEKILDAERH